VFQFNCSKSIIAAVVLLAGVSVTRAAYGPPEAFERPAVAFLNGSLGIGMSNFFKNVTLVISEGNFYLFTLFDGNGNKREH
jgi:hypothetical protein